MSNIYRPTALVTDNFRMISDLMSRLSLLRFSGRLDLYSSTKKTTLKNILDTFVAGTSDV
jgi:hypothetical protein